MSGWRGEAPTLPGFDRGEEIAAICGHIRDTVTDSATPYLPVALAAAKLSGVWRPGMDEPLMLRALHTRRYGVLYWTTPEVVAAAGSCDEDALDTLGAWLDDSGWTGRLWNATVVVFVRSAGLPVVYAEERVPAYGIQPTVDRTLVMRREDLVDSRTALGCERHLFDLHDLAHLAATTLDAGLYGNRFHTSLPELPRPLRDLVAGFTAGSQTQFSDGLIFSELLTPLFEALDPAMPEPEAVETLAGPIADYLCDGRPLPHAGLRRTVRAARPVDPFELATLMQNKPAEQAASEIEQHLFVRGGFGGRDKLHPLSASGRERAIAALTGRTHHERRNTLKHRAHTRAYVEAARRLLDRPGWTEVETRLLEYVAEAAPFQAGERHEDLFAVVAEAAHQQFGQVGYCDAVREAA